MYCDVADEGIHVCQLLSYFEKIPHMSVFLAYVLQGPIRLKVL